MVATTSIFLVSGNSVNAKTTISSKSEVDSIHLEIFNSSLKTGIIIDIFIYYLEKYQTTGLSKKMIFINKKKNF